MTTHIEATNHGAERRRLVTAGSIGVVAGAATSFVVPWQLAMLLWWDIVAAVLLTWIWISIATRSGKATKAEAPTRDDDSRATGRPLGRHGSRDFSGLARVSTLHHWHLERRSGRGSGGTGLVLGGGQCGYGRPVGSRERVSRGAGRYEIGPVIGQGGMGRVHLALDTRLSRDVAIKVLRLGIAEDPEHRARFEREALLTARINHPNVVTVYDVGDEDGDLYLVMELLPGRTLADEIQLGLVTAARARNLAVELLAGLGAAHDQGVLHRDIKPGNILLTAAGSAKLADFGIAKLRDALDLTDAGLLLGTAHYLPPERWDGLPASESGDLYSLAAVLYEALTGRPAFDGETPAELARAVATSNPPPIDDLRAGVDPLLVAALDRAMSHDLAERFATAADMAAAIIGHHLAVPATVPLQLPDTTRLGGPTASPTTHLPPQTARLATASTLPEVRRRAPVRRRARRHRLAMAVAAVVVVAGALLALVASRGPSHPTEVPATRSTTPVSVASPSTSAVSPTTTLPATPPTTLARPHRGHGKGAGG